MNSADHDSYIYDPWGRRVWKQDHNSYSGTTTAEAYFYGATGQKLETYGCNWNSIGTLAGGSEGINTYFAGKMLSEKGVFIATDRLGSVRSDSNGVSMSYYPWGEERGTGTADNRTKFAGYYRDMPGQDYAMARFYSASSGSFWSPDPGGIKTANPKNPGSWNRYGYVSGDDPLNFLDPEGTEDCPVDTCVTVSAGIDPLIAMILAFGPASPPRSPLPNDPQQLNIINLRAGARLLQHFVTMGLENDCQALADFSDFAAQGGTTASQFDKDFSVLTPNQFPVNIIPGIQGSSGSNLVALNVTSQPSGFGDLFQDEDPTADQAHHFAAFFQLGFAYGPLAGAAAAKAWETMEGTSGNTGDIDLGIIASFLGPQVKVGNMSPADVGGFIRNNICKH